MKYKYFSQNGQILPAGQAVVSLELIEYSYGFGVYETIRVNKGVLLFLKEHCDRLITSAKIIGLAHTFNTDDIAKNVRELTTANELQAGNIKILLIGGLEPESAMLMMICLNPLFLGPKVYKQGVSCITYEYEREYPNAKTLNMLSSYLARRKAREKGAYDALLVDHDGYIREGTMTNLLGLKGQTVISPPQSKILPGVTRAKVLEQASKIGFKIDKRDIALEDINDLDALFLTSTSSKILPINCVDGVELKVDSVQLHELMQAFDAYIKQYLVQETAF